MKMPAIKKALASKTRGYSLQRRIVSCPKPPHEEQDEFVEDDAEGEMKRNQERAVQGEREKPLQGDRYWQRQDLGDKDFKMPSAGDCERRALRAAACIRKN
jgi:hypothetical protein